MHIPPEKLLFKNSEAVMNGENSVPLIYKNKNNFVEKVNARDMENTYCEGEGASVAFKQNHLKKNVIFVSNDTVSLFYCLITAIKRDEVENKYLNQFWLGINYTSKLTGLSG